MKNTYKEQYKYLSNACLNLTDDCNLACRYCFVEQHPNYMTYEIAKQAVDFLIKNLRFKKKKGWISKDAVSMVTFFGGEPMLLWDKIIIPIIEYSKLTYPNEISFNMTTNGTLLNKEKIDYLYENNVGLLLSIDGAPETQNYNRPCKNSNQNSFDLVINNIPYLLEKYPNITFRATITQDTVNKTFENYMFAAYLGFKNIFIMPNYRENWSEENKNILNKEIEKIFVYIKNCFEKNILPINNSTIDAVFEWILLNDLVSIGKKEFNRNISRSPQRCGLGVSAGSIGFDGKIYGCQEQNSKELKNIFLIGDINNGIDVQKHQMLVDNYTKISEMKCEKEEKCNNCYLKQICLGFSCPSSSWDMFHSFFIDSEIACDWRNILFKNSLTLMQILVNNNNELFKEYLNNNCNFSKYF